MTLPRAGSTRSASLRSILTSDADISVIVRARQRPTGGGTSCPVVARQVDSASYQSTLVLARKGSVRLNITKVVGAKTTRIASRTIAGLTHHPGDRMRLRVQALGTSPTTVQARVWKVGKSQPTGWQVSATDSTDGLQSAGSVGLVGSLSGSSTATPVTLTYDGLRIYDTQG